MKLFSPVRMLCSQPSSSVLIIIGKEGIDIGVISVIVVGVKRSMIHAVEVCSDMDTNITVNNYSKSR